MIITVWHRKMQRKKWKVSDGRQLMSDGRQFRIQRWYYPRKSKGPGPPSSSGWSEKSNGSQRPIHIDQYPLTIIQKTAWQNQPSPKPYHHQWITIRWDEILKSIAIHPSIHQLGQPCVRGEPRVQAKWHKKMECTNGQGLSLETWTQVTSGKSVFQKQAMDMGCSERQEQRAKASA